jgi:hypothetical protein
MLNRNNAELELKKAIQQLLPGWEDKLVAATIPRAEYYIDELLNILPDFTAAQHSNQNPNQRLTQLRRRLLKILTQEQELLLEKSLCDTAFDIQIALAKLFPFNKEVTTDENEQTLAVEAWEETFTFEVITRETTDLIIFPESAVLTRESTEAYYQGRFGKDEQGNPRNFDNTLMTDRQIYSLQQQGIDIQKPAPVAEQDYDLAAEANGDESFGKYLGAKLGKIITFTTAFLIMTLCRGPVLFGASCFVGGITGTAAGLKGFTHGFLSTFLLGAAAQTLFAVTTAAAFVGGVLAEDTTTLALDLLSAGTLPLVLPAIVFVAAIGESIRQNKNLSDTFTKMTTDIFFNIPIKFSATLGESIGNGITAIYQFLKNSSSRSNNELPAHPSSHAVIMQSIAVNPAQVEQIENTESRVLTHANPNPVLINAPLSIENDRNNVDSSARNGISLTN